MKTRKSQSVLRHRFHAWIGFRLLKDWSDQIEKYPQIKGTEDFLVAPCMETGMKEYIRQKFDHFKTKEVLALTMGLLNDRHLP